MPSNCKNLNPPNFSLPTTFKVGSDSRIICNEGTGTNHSGFRKLLPTQQTLTKKITGLKQRLWKKPNAVCFGKNLNTTVLWRTAIE
jgi:hypothetical protein